ncbi:ParB/RepB/Spo0J family partition protein [Cronobacter sakazakii]|nr:ParB/RepB/Spo0J family partition protein [Cronobacter sakazakii]
MNSNEIILDTLSSVLDEGEYIVDFPVDKIRITPQVRRKYNPTKVEEIALSIQKQGQIQPCVLSEPDEEGMADLVVGFTRYYATLKNGAPTLKAVIRKQPEEIARIRVIQMAENMHREDLDIVDTALGVVEMNKTLKPKEICESLGVGNSWVSKMLSIGKLPVELLDDLSALTNDVETYYLLAQIYKKSQELVYSLVNDAKESGELKRADVKDAQANLKGGVKPTPAGEATDTGKEEAADINSTINYDASEDGAPVPDEIDGLATGDDESKVKGSLDDNDGAGSAAPKIPTPKKAFKVVVSFIEDGATIEGYLVTNQESTDNGMVAVTVEGKDMMVATEELKLVRIIHA